LKWKEEKRAEDNAPNDGSTSPLGNPRGMGGDGHP